MAIGTTMEVGLGLVTEYIFECESTQKRVWDGDKEDGVIGELPCIAHKTKHLSHEECQWVHSCVLRNSTCLDELKE